MKLKLRSRNSRTTSPRGSGRMEEAPSVTDAVLVKELTATFRVFDKDGNGKISKEELGEVLRSLGDNVTDCELDAVMAKLGGDDGCIDLPQFIAFHTNKTPVSRSSGTSDAEDEDPEVAALRSAFAVFDIDKNGFISAEELQRVMHTLGDKHTSLAECRHMISCVDRDGDKMVDFSEFRSLMSGTSVLSC